MERRACRSYEAGFDACDPFGSVLEWSARGPARILRRRCRSEGVDRSAYEDVCTSSGTQRYLAYHNKSQFTLNNVIENHFIFRDCPKSAAENGDYIMASDHKKIDNHLWSGKLKLRKTSPIRPVLVTTLSNTIIEERVDHDMAESIVTKQPLKSILNNPVRKSTPPGILKKPKSKLYSESKDGKSAECRRRQRAVSESDNFYSAGVLSHVPNAYDGRHFTNSTKRAKDNFGSGYSYGAAISSLNANYYKSPNVNQPKIYKGFSKDLPVAAKPSFHKNLPVTTHPVKDNGSIRTTPIKKNAPVVNEDLSTIAKARLPVVSQESTTNDRSLLASPVRKNTVPKKKKTKTNKSAKSAKMKDINSDNLNNTFNKCERMPSPDLLMPDHWTMQAEAFLLEIEKLGNKVHSSAEQVEKAREVERLVTRQPLPKQTLPQQAQGQKPLIQQPLAEQSPIQQPPIQQLPIQQLPTIQLTTLQPLTQQPQLQKSRVILNHYQKETTEKGLPRMAITGTQPENTLDLPLKVQRNKTREQMFITALNTINPFQNYSRRKASLLHLPDSMTDFLRFSLFPRVPPYLKFIPHDESPALKVPQAIQKHMKWKFTTITPIVVRKTLVNSGFRLVKSECDTAECPQEETVEWVGIWGKHMKSLLFGAIKDGQKLNHFPGTFQIGRKDRLWRNLQKLVARFGSKEFGIMPKTYVLPQDMKLLKLSWDKHVENNERWIIKPPASARGTGIKVVSRWTQIPKKRSVVVQRYVTKPFLINGSKFDLRLYVLLTSIHPLRIYLYKDGLARFASVKYTEEITHLNDRYMHLTNYSINRLSKNYTPNEDFAACEGHKWTLKTLFQYLKNNKRVNIDDLWSALKDLVIKTMISGEASISALTKRNITSRYNCYELFGIDVLLDEDLKPWLLEVNISPSLHSASPLDIHVKGPLVTTVLNIAQFQVPDKVNLEALSKDKASKLTGLPYDSRLYTVYLSKEERDKHVIYTNMEDREMYLRDMLSTLTSDDVRHLIQAEDELTQTGDMERVFPSHETYRYLGFLSGPRYYNRLFDAWETRYHLNRNSGIDLLRSLCEIGYHLEVPPIPLKNDVDAPTPPVSEHPSVASIPSVEPHSPSSDSEPSGSTTFCGSPLPLPAVSSVPEPRA